MHKFKVGSLIRVKASQGVNLAGVYEVVRLLPVDETGTPTYEVKGPNEEHMRVVSQHHIEAAGQD